MTICGIFRMDIWQCFLCFLLPLVCVIPDSECIAEYKSCAEVAASIGSNASDGEYVLYLNKNLGVTIYCTGFSDGHPREFLTLTAGRLNNFASVYPNIGTQNTSSCRDVQPVQPYSQGGRTKFDKIRLDLTTLHVQTNDFSYSQQSGRSPVRYGYASDKFSAQPNCSPRGTFKIDLAGTPFTVASNIQWVWKGSFAGGSTAKGVAHITNNSYIGCFTDTGDRLLSDHSEDNPHLTTEICIQRCKSLGFWFAGTQYRTQCYCGDNHDRHSLASESDCNAPCGGNNKEMCGGTWRISVYSTGARQIYEGRCGGFPGGCFPATTLDPSTPVLALQVVSTHPCLQPISPCKNEGKCIASTATDFRCLCYPGYTGSLCDIASQVVTTSTTCPDGMVAEKCTCDRRCYGAEFKGGTCKVFGPQGAVRPKTTCRTGDGDHIIMFNVDGSGMVKCPQGSNLTGCTFRDRGYYPSPASKFMTDTGEATQIRYNTGTCSLLHNCQSCTLQARCKKFDCGCQNGGHCHRVTGECVCTTGYYGDKCENFDYCGYYEKHNNVTACGAGGICSAVPQDEIKAYGGDNAGDTCIFPFQYGINSYGSCVQTNNVGPPFACGTKFDGQRDGYMDLGLWSPGTQYTIAAWVRPDVADGTRRTIVGGVGGCRDFGLYQFENFWAYYRGQGSQSHCTRGLSAVDHIQTGQWYLVASIKNTTHVTIYVNGKQKSILASPNALPTTEGFWIGGEECCEQGRFKGMIKTVKIWKRALDPSHLKRSMETFGTANTTTEVLEDGLVGHWELGEVIQPPCVGEDHGGEDWILDQSSIMIISGSHCNISQFTVPKNIKVYVKPWNGTTGGTLKIQAKNILIAGTLSANGAGYRGGSRPSAGATGQQGESYPGLGKTSTQDNRGGGGGGLGGSTQSDHRGKPGAGAGYGSAAQFLNRITRKTNTGFGTPGKVYGDSALSDLFMGSGGGSGGSASNLTINPAGGKGGNGGGAISLKAELSVKITGQVTATGDSGQGDTSSLWCPLPCTMNPTASLTCSSQNTTACWDESGPGGGGSGGSIFISAKTVSVVLPRRWRLDVSGGDGGHAPLGFAGGVGGSGRVRIEYVTYTGDDRYTRHTSSIYTTATLQNEYPDHSLAGQQSINLATTKYGNEVLRGCFVDNTTYRMLSVAVSLTTAQKQSLTQEKCMALCRLKGYKYSGTEYYNECYCDNHLKMQLKRPDGECNTACTGDATQMCGGTYRILVFGPPPSKPAIGHSGAVSKCEPWCVTAEQFSITPKWGQCALTTEFVTSWQIHCECPAGFTGVGCAEVCAEWTWGSACRGNCSCNITNSVSCLSQTGQCQCKPGYYGQQCQSPCPDGQFGPNCLYTCNCTGATDCDKSTGKCMCQPGWYGHSCSFPCPRGVWGRNCSSTCNCNSGGSCNPVDGTCECDPGYKLPNCAEKCELGEYGPDCMFICDCNGQACDPVSGVCDCDDGFTGHRCDQPCPYNTYGKHCRQNCQCLVDFDCDHKTGACLCGPGFLGAYCEQPCPQGTFGVTCREKCICQMNQTDKCDTETGLCTCKPGFLGDDCTVSCPIGFFGPDCTSTCNCHNEAHCDRETGVCTCPPGWTGTACENTCPEPFYGNCSTRCLECLNGFCDKGTGQCRTCSGTTCACSEGFYGDRCQNECACFHGHCSSNGQCVCSPGWQGSQCDQQCPTDHYGPGCNQTCHCDHGKCHQEIGTCLCDPGYKGDRCDQPCSNTTYGSNCRRECLSCEKFSTGTCDSVTGHCHCQSGYSGILCTQPCSTGKFGVNCSQACACERGTCRQTDGFCYCPDGWTGAKCTQNCPLGTWGYNCSNRCDCGLHSTGCDPTSGLCQCKPGFAGVRCTESCKDGFYGQDCARSCRCNPFGFSMCSPIDGSCQCRFGYTGDLCERVCDPGNWGLRCKMICECSNHGNCNPFTGACDCLPGYNGTSCQFSCPNTTYGDNCGQSCNCNGGTCDPRNGLCYCPPGKKGHHCELDCESTHFGFDCAQPCVCQNEGVCNPVNGDCHCQPGWSGVRCDQECPEGQFGVDCAQSCPPCQNDGSCDSVTGQCTCAAGFMGPLCNETCTPGVWGSGCSTKCPLACSLTCFTTTGMCTCLPGTCLNGGTCDAKGLCSCVPGFYGSDCSQTTQWSGSVSAHTSTRSSNSGGIYLSKGSMAGLVLGLIIMALIAVTAVFLLMRKKYTGQFIKGPGGVAQTDFSPEVKDETTDGAAGFSNPLHFTEFSTSKSDPDLSQKDSAA